MNMTNPYDFDVLCAIHNLRENRKIASMESVQGSMRRTRAARDTSDFTLSVIAGLTSVFFTAGSRRLGNYFDNMYRNLDLAIMPPRHDYTTNAITSLEESGFIGILKSEGDQPENYYVTSRGLCILNGEDPDEPNSGNIFFIHWD